MTCKALKDTCLVDYEQLDSYNYVTCYSIWWIYRTMLMVILCMRSTPRDNLCKSWGDFHIEEMTSGMSGKTDHLQVCNTASDASILFFIMAYIVLNIILLNLLIALMSDTYQEGIALCRLVLSDTNLSESPGDIQQAVVAGHIPHHQGVLQVPFSLALDQLMMGSESILPCPVL
eukprot:764932-Hanusia_phi.AAC.3